MKDTETRKFDLAVVVLTQVRGKRISSLPIIIEQENLQVIQRHVIGHDVLFDQIIGQRLPVFAFQIPK
ncbi:hypothetical protein D3C81_1965990 [compost metagenome]